MKRHLRSFNIQEMQTEFTRYHYTSTEMAKHVKNWQYLTSTDEKVEKMEHSYIAGGTTKWFRQFRKQFGNFSKSYAYIYHMTK